MHCLGKSILHRSAIFLITLSHEQLTGASSECSQLINLIINFIKIIVQSSIISARTLHLNCFRTHPAFFPLISHHPAVGALNKLSRASTVESLNH